MNCDRRKFFSVFPLFAVGLVKPPQDERIQVAGENVIIRDCTFVSRGGDGPMIEIGKAETSPRVTLTNSLFRQP